MFDLTPSVSNWLWDYYLLGTALFVTVLLVTRLIQQPARRVAIHWATAVGLLLLALLCAIPSWSILHMTSPPPPEAVAWMEHLEPVTGPAIQIAHLPQTFEPIAPVLDELPADAEISQVTLAERIVVIDYGILASYAIGCGALISLLWLTMGAWQVRRLRSQAVPASEQLHRLMVELTNPSRGMPAIGVSERLTVAVAVGLRRPMVLLPRTLAEESGPHELRTVLAHELAHIGNRDLWLLAVVRSLLPLLWVHPLYWMWRRGLRLDQETLADAAASEQTSQADYADQLVTWARSAAGIQTPRFASSVGLWESPSQLKRRLAILLDGKLTVLRDCSRSWRFGSIVMLMIATFGLSLITLQPESTAVEQTSTTEQAQESDLSFVRVVVSRGDRVTFEGHETTREALPKLLETVTDRANTVLEFAVVSEEISVRKLNELKHQMMVFADRYGYKYSSYVGVHTLGSRGTKSNHTNQESESNSHTPTTSFNGKVKIVAIGTHGDQPQRWWDADGHPLESVPFQWQQANPNDIGGGGAALSPQSLVRRFVLKVDGLPEDGRISWWRQQGIRGTTGAVITIDNRPNPHGYKAQTIAFSKDQRTIDLRIGIAGSPWKTMHKLLGSGYHGKNGKSVTLFAPQDGANPVQVAVSHNYAEQDYRIFAVDKQGKEHIQAGWGGRNSNGLVTAHASFPGLTAKDVDHYLFKVRNYEWVELKNLPIAPDHLGDASKTAHQQALADSYREIYEKVEALHKVGGAGGETHKLLLAKYYWQSATAELFEQQSKRQEAIQQYAAALKSAEEYVPAVKAVQDSGRVTVKEILEARKLLAEAMIKLHRAKKREILSEQDNESVTTTSASPTLGLQFDPAEETGIGSGLTEMSEDDMAFALLPVTPITESTVADSEELVFERADPLAVADESQFQAEIQQDTVVPATSPADPAPDEILSLDPTGGPTVPSDLADTEASADGFAIKAPAKPDFQKLLFPRYKQLEKSRMPNTIVGICIDERGQPLANVEVRLFSQAVGPVRQQKPTLVATTKTDARGKFELTDVLDVPKMFPEGVLKSFLPGKQQYICTLIGKLPGRVPGTHSGLAASLANSGSTTVWVMQKAKTLRGRITDTQGNPVQGATVKAGHIAMFNGLNDAMHAVAVTDAQGDYTITDLARYDAAQEDRQIQETVKKNPQLAGNMAGGAPRQQLLVTHPKFAAQRVPVERIPSTVNARLQPGSVIEGKVAFPNDEQPDSIAAGVVYLQRDVPQPEAGESPEMFSYQVQETQLDAEGRYRFESLPAGTYHLSAGIPDWVTIGIENVVTNIGKTKTAPEIAMTRGGRVRVQLVDDSGKPLHFDKPMPGWINPHRVPREKVISHTTNVRTFSVEGTAETQLAPGTYRLNVNVPTGEGQVAWIASDFAEIRSPDDLQKIDTVNVVEGKTFQLRVKTKKWNPQGKAALSSVQAITEDGDLVQVEEHESEDSPFVFFPVQQTVPSVSGE